MSQADFEYLMPVYRVLEEEKQEGWLSEEEFNREVKIYVEAQGVKLADFLAAVERMSEKGKKGA